MKFIYQITFFLIKRSFSFLFIFEIRILFISYIIINLSLLKFIGGGGEIF